MSTAVARATRRHPWWRSRWERCYADTYAHDGASVLYQPPACCTYRRHRAACPGRGTTDVRWARARTRAALLATHYPLPLLASYNCLLTAQARARSSCGSEAGRRRSHSSVCSSAQEIYSSSAARQHGQSGPLALPRLASCASSGHAWRLWAARHSQGEVSPLSAQPPPRMLEPAASTGADSTAVDHSGAARAMVHGVERLEAGSAPAALRLGADAGWRRLCITCREH